MRYFYTLFVLLIANAAISAKVTTTLPYQEQIEVSVTPIPKSKNKRLLKKQSKKQQRKTKDKRKRAIGAIVGGGFLILLGLGFLFLSVFSFLTGGGLGGLVGYLALMLIAAGGGLLLILKGINKLKTIGQRKEPSNYNNKGLEENGKAVY